MIGVIQPAAAKKQGMFRRVTSRRGAVLAVAVLLMVIAAVAALGVTVFITERVVLVEARSLSEKALYAAQAGVHGAVFSYRLRAQSGNGYFPLGFYQIDPHNAFTLSGSQSDLLMVDTSSAGIGGDYCETERQECREECDETWAPCYTSCDDDYGMCLSACPPGPSQACPRACQRERDQVCYAACDNQRNTLCYSVCETDYQSCMSTAPINYDLVGITLQNATNSQTLAIDRMIIAWGNNRRLREVVIDGQVRWSGNAGSPATVTLNPAAVISGPSVPVTHLINAIRFNNNMTGVAYITIQFVMTDGTVRTVNAYPAGPDNFSFRVTSTGETAGAGSARTVRAVYQAGPVNARISAYGEAD